MWKHMQDGQKIEERVTVVAPGATMTMIRDQFGFKHHVSNRKLKALKDES